MLIPNYAFHSVNIIIEIYSHTFFEKFRESNSVATEVTKELISRNIFFSDSKLLVFPHCATS